MLSIIKLQNLKAIHNPKFLLAAEPSDVINHKTTKFEAIHNKASRAYWVSSDVINHKTTKFESNSQLSACKGTKK